MINLENLTREQLVEICTELTAQVSELRVMMNERVIDRARLYQS